VPLGRWARDCARQKEEVGMNQHQQAFFIPFGLWMLLGVILIVRVFIITIKATKVTNPTSQAKEIQKRFTTVGFILMGTLPVAYGVYYLLRG
jgi:uncharacterized membrane protein